MAMIRFVITQQMDNPPRLQLAILMLFLLLQAPYALNAWSSRATLTGAANIKVVCDRWPDGAGMRQFALDAIRLMNAGTDEEKALAIWRFIRMWSSAADGRIPREPALKNMYIDDPVKVLNVYGAHWCDGLARALEVAWRSLGFRAEKLYRSGHTQADVHWRDEDGISRWHMLDLSQGWYVYDRTGKHIASPDEIALDYSLIFRPSNTPVPKIPHYCNFQNWVHAPHLAWPKHSMAIDLRPKERLTRYWSNPFLAYQDNFGHRGQIDFEHGPYPVTYGNGMLEYSPDLTSKSYEKGLHVPPENLASVGEDGKGPNLHCKVPGVPGVVIFNIKSPYIISDASIDGKFYRKGGSDRIAIAISTDDAKTWRTVWNAQGMGQISLSRLEIADKFDIYKAIPGDLITAFGRYEYLVRIEMEASSSASDVGIDEFSMTTITQHNIFSLPQLWPGKNTITVTGEIGSDVSVVVNYIWQDKAGTERSHTALVESSPFSYVIDTAGNRWEDVKVKSLVVEAVPRVGKGNRIKGDEKRVTAWKNITPAQAFPTEKIIGPSQPLPLKSVSSYLTDLEYPGKQVEALAGLIVVGNKSCLPQVKRIAFESTAFPNKVMAIQALYLIGGKESIPALIEILKKSPGVVWRSDPGNKLVELEHWYAVSALIGHIMAEANETAAVPHILSVLESIAKNDYQAWESHASILRSIGRLRATVCIPSVRLALYKYEDLSAMAIWTLGELKDTGSVAFIRDLLYGAKYPVQTIRAAEALGKLGCWDISPKLYEMLDSDDEDYRAAAVEALARLNDRGALPYLESLLKTESFPWVRWIAQTGMESLPAEPEAPDGADKSWEILRRSKQ